MIWIIIGIAVYLLSVFGMWRYFHLAYSEKGVLDINEADSFMIFVIFIPIINTFLNIAWLADHPTNKTIINYNKFFNIKE